MGDRIPPSRTDSSQKRRRSFPTPFVCATDRSQANPVVPPHAEVNCCRASRHMTPQAHAKPGAQQQRSRHPMRVQRSPRSGPHLQKRGGTDRRTALHRRCLVVEVGILPGPAAHLQHPEMTALPFPVGAGIFVQRMDTMAGRAAHVICSSMLFLNSKRYAEGGTVYMIEPAKS